MNLSKIIKIYNSKTSDDEFDEFDVNDRMIVEGIIYGIFDTISMKLGKELKNNDSSEIDTKFINYKAERRVSEDGEENVSVNLNLK